MRKPVAGFWWSPTVEGVPALIVTAAFFALGGLAGCFLAFHAADSGAEALGAYLEQFLASARSGTMAPAPLPTLLWKTFRWPLGAILLGFSAVGMVGIPLLSGGRGFFLGFSVAAFARSYGRTGLMAAFLLQGIPAVAALPAFFLLAVQSLSAACVLAWKEPGPGRREGLYGADLYRSGLCLAAVFVSFLLERYLVPLLIAGWASGMP